MYSRQIGLIKQMALDSRVPNNIQLKIYHGGHMPYLQQDAREALFKDALRFYGLAP